MERTRKKDIVVAAGGLGREIASVLTKYFDQEYEFIGFVDDGLKKGSEVNSYPVLGGLQLLKNSDEKYRVFIGIGNPQVNYKIIDDLEIDDSPLEFPNLISPNAHLHNEHTIKMGVGNILCDGLIITTNISIGDFNLLNLATTIGHDALIGNYCSLKPSVNINGGALEIMSM